MFFRPLFLGFVIGIALMFAIAVDTGRAQGAPTQTCVIYDTDSNVAIWVSKSRVNTAIFVDQGDDAYWVRNQERVAFYSVPKRVTNVVENWSVVPHRGLRVRNCTRGFTSISRRAIRACLRRVNSGDAYTRELFDQCVADYIEMEVARCKRCM